MAELDNKLNDPLGTTPRVPSVSGALGQLQDVTKQQVESTKRLGELEAEKLKQTPLIQKEKLEAEKAYRDVAAKEKEGDIASAERDMSQFKVSQDSITGMSALGTAILMIGQALGRSGGQQSAMGAIQGMTGMMQGYTKGRADEFKRNQVEFDRNFKIMQDKIKRANDKFQVALAEMPYNTIDAQTKATQALAELDSPILKEKYNKQGLVETAGFISKLYDAAQESAKRAQALALAKGKGVGKEILPEIQGVRAINNLMKQLDDPEVKIGLTAKLAPFKEKMSSIFRNDKEDFESAVNTTLTGTDKTTLFLKNALLETYAIERAAKGGQRLTVQDMKMVGPVLDPTNYKPETYKAILEDRRRSLYNSLQDRGMSQEEINTRAQEQPYTPYGGTQPTETGTPKRTVSSAEAKEYYEKHKDQFKSEDEAKQYLKSQGYQVQ